MITRRKFLAAGAVTLTGVPFSRSLLAPQEAQILDPAKLPPFVDPLPILPLARQAGTRAYPQNGTDKLPLFRVAMLEARVKVHRDLPPTPMWTFGGSFPGPTIETTSGKALIVDWDNRLPTRHFLPIDHSLHGAGKEVPDVRTVVHLHGGRTPADSDGYPENWIVPGKTQTCYYPCPQEAAHLFYHDHAMGINRLNVYAGLQGMFIVRDAQEAQLGLPSGKYEIPLLICDRILRKDGQLVYPVSEKPGEVWVPEAFGETILTNGKLQPFLEVEPRIYRFRLMNGANGRFFRFSLANRQEFFQIGSDQGLLAEPVRLKRVTMAPGERTDLLIDFSAMAGERVEWISDSFSILQFRVGKTASGERGNIPSKLRTLDRLPEASAIKVRRLTLDENMDDIQRSRGMLLNNTPWHAPVTENPTLNSIEIWELVNLTDDSHPIHLHLVRFQILDRRRIDVFHFQQKNEIRFGGPAVPPDPNELGWKDTVRADPHMVTRIIVPFTDFAGRYVWHCHILEHEDNEMMRPFDVLSA